MKLALGTAQFGLEYGVANRTGRVGAQEISDILDFAKLAKIDTIDTAAAYGESEVSLGQASVSDFRIVTKLPPMPDEIGDAGLWVRRQIETSLEKLRVQSVFGYLLHRPELLGGSHGEAIASALVDAKRDGLVSKVGISIYDPEQIPAAAQRLELDLVQAPLNLMDRRIAESGWTQRLREDGVELHTRSSFLQGLLLMERDRLPPYFSRWGALFAEWHDWLADKQISATSACLDFARSLPEVDRIVVGVDSRRQLEVLVEGLSSDDSSDHGWPDIRSDDPDLINPARWSLN